MDKKSQIELIKLFLKSSENNLILNQVNDEIGQFYLNLIKYYGQKQGINFKLSEHQSQNSGNDLFGEISINIYISTNIKKVEELLNLNEKKIIFTDYKNYKKLISKTTINGYQFEKDIEGFIKLEHNINNKELLFYCKNNPALLISEISKFIINEKNYLADHNIQEITNHILEIRKEIYEIKKSKINLKDLYSRVKDESRYKKFNFLTY